MAVAFVKQSAEAYGLEVSSFAPSLASVVAGNCCVVKISYVPSGTADVAVPTPTTGWSVAVAPTTGDGNAYDSHAGIFYKQNAGSGTQTATFSLPAGSYIGGQISEYSGVSTTAALDVVAFTDSNNATTGSVTTAANTVADAVIVTNVCVNAENPSTPPTTGYTAIGQDPGDNITYSAAYKILSAEAAQSATWTWSGSGYTFHYIAVAAVFKADDSGGTTDAAITPAAGVATTSTLTGSSTAASTITPAAGVATASTMAGSSTDAASFTSASGSATTSTLASNAIVTSSFVSADGVATTSTLASNAIVSASFTDASGTATTATLTATATAVASFVEAQGVATTSTLIAFGASVIDPAVGQATTSTLAATVTAAASFLPATGIATTSTLIGSDASAPPGGSPSAFRPIFRPRRR